MRRVENVEGAAQVAHASPTTDLSNTSVFRQVSDAREPRKRRVAPLLSHADATPDSRERGALIDARGDGLRHFDVVIPPLLALVDQHRR